MTALGRLSLNRHWIVPSRDRTPAPRPHGGGYYGRACSGDISVGGCWFAFLLLGLPCQDAGGTASRPAKKRSIWQLNPSQYQVELNGCWTWLGKTDKDGYGLVRDNTRPRVRRAHRLYFEIMRGPIPVGKVIDHLCSNRRCVNPSHLEPVTQRINVLRGAGVTAIHARQTHCKHGHPLDAANTYSHKGHRYCRTCRHAWIKAYRKREAAPQHES